MAISRGRWVGLILLAFASPAAAQLQWESLTQEMETEGGRVTATFRFTNAGAYPLTITGVEAVDRGVSARLRGKRTVSAGGSGEVVVATQKGLLFEPVRVQARVSTDERGVEAAVLTLSATPAGWSKLGEAEQRQLAEEGNRIAALPAPFTVEPRVLVWHPGEAPDSKTAVVTMSEATRASRIVELENELKDDGGFGVEITPLEEGRYRVTVTPTGEDRKATRAARFRLQTDLPEDYRKRMAMDPGLSLTVVAIGERGAGTREPAP